MCEEMDCEGRVGQPTSAHVDKVSESWRVVISYERRRGVEALHFTNCPALAVIQGDLLDLDKNGRDYVKEA
jgi:hypothetical protein